MRWIIPLVGLLVVACAADDGKWPSLARRPGEAATMVPRGGASGQPAVFDPAEPAATAADPVPRMPPVAPAGIDDVAARLNTIARDINDVTTRLKAQEIVLVGAIKAMHAAPTNAEASGTAELERTRLERIGGQIGDLRDKLDTIAGQLADAAAAGVDTTAQIKTTGGLIARTRALDADYTAAMAAAGTVLPH